MRIAVIGVGGIGGYFGGRLAAVGEDVVFIARGKHLEALRSHGLRIESPLGDFAVPSVEATDTPEEVGSVDVVFVAGGCFPTLCLSLPFRLFLALQLLRDLLDGADSLWALSLEALEIEVLDEQP
ncbi:MAG: hypothetical protein IH798_02320 [Gemmatimonadetes bacterium]|nr:hypothetical protein [Gemmatimonadota bacterium]